MFGFVFFHSNWCWLWPSHQLCYKVIWAWRTCPVPSHTLAWFWDCRKECWEATEKTLLVTMEEGIAWWEELLVVMAFGERVENDGFRAFGWRIWRRQSRGPWGRDRSTGVEIGGLFHSVVGLQCWGNMEAPEGQGLMGMSVVPGWKKTRKLSMWFREQPCRYTTSLPCRDPPWDDRTFPVLASLPSSWSCQQGRCLGEVWQHLICVSALGDPRPVVTVQYLLHALL